MCAIYRKVAMTWSLRAVLRSAEAMCGPALSMVCYMYQMRAMDLSWYDTRPWVLVCKLPEFPIRETFRYRLQSSLLRQFVIGLRCIPQADTLPTEAEFTKELRNNMETCIGWSCRSGIYWALDIRNLLGQREIVGPGVPEFTGYRKDIWLILGISGFPVWAWFRYVTSPMIMMVISWF